MFGQGMARRCTVTTSWRGFEFREKCFSFWVIGKAVMLDEIINYVQILQRQIEVHHGFYSAYHNTTLLYEILKSIKWARKMYGNLPINVVGHSMGGDLASFCALDLF
ncbi:alpha/beta-Hydrolases superfamily protein, partial [Zea mays]